MDNYFAHSPAHGQLNHADFVSVHLPRCWMLTGSMLGLNRLRRVLEYDSPVRLLRRPLGAQMETGCLHIHVANLVSWLTKVRKPVMKAYS